MNKFGSKKRLQAVLSIPIGVMFITAGIIIEQPLLTPVGLFFIFKGIFSQIATNLGALKQTTANLQKTIAQKNAAQTGSAAKSEDEMRSDLAAIFKKALRAKDSGYDEFKPHSHMTDATGRFNPTVGSYSMPGVEVCVCPKCGTVTNTSRRFCYNCDTDLKEAHSR